MGKWLRFIAFCLFVIAVTLMILNTHPLPIGILIVIAWVIFVIGCYKGPN